MTIVCFGEVLARLSPPGGRLIAQAHSFDLHFGGAEANVAVSLARLGAPSRMASVLPDDELGHAARDALRSHGVNTSALAFAPGEMGLYFLNPAAALRPANVIYHRSASAFAHADTDAIDWSRALAGATWLHLSGISPALGPQATEATLRAARAATDKGVAISFDGNYRGKLWSSWRADGGAPILRELMAHATLAFANERDIALILDAPFEDAASAATAAFAAFPKLQRIASTTRQFHDPSRIELGAFVIGRSATAHAAPQPLGVIVDRIGAGDAFAAGLIYALRENMADQDAAAFALAAACLKHGQHGDFNLVSAAEIHAFLAGEKPDVKR